MSTLKTNTIQHLTSGFNNVVQFVDGAGTQNGTLCRAWVNFNGTGTVAIRAQFNVSSITDHATGQYTINLTNALPDANYAFSVAAGSGTVVNWIGGGPQATPTTSTLRIFTGTTGGWSDLDYVSVTIFR